MTGWTRTAHTLLGPLKPWLRPLKPYVLELYRRLLAGGRAVFLFVTTGRTEDRYGIKAFYLPRAEYHHFDARTSGEIHQDQIYKNLRAFFDREKLSSVLDIGCGTAFKLVKYFGDQKTLGLERPPVLGTLSETYPEKEWGLSDFDHPPQGSFDMVISVDVIEHLPDPDRLLDMIAQIDCRYVAISTPDRARLGRAANVGPPKNRHHMREWSQDEFVRYLARHFKVLASNVVRQHEHYVICRK